MDKRSPRTLAVALAFAAAVGAALFVAVPVFADQGGSGLQPTVPNGDSPNGHNIYNLYLLISIPAILIFLLVEGLLLAIIIRFRRTKRPVGFIPPQWHGNTALEIAWTVIPALIIGLIGLLSFLELQQDFTRRTDAESQMNITVQGYRFGWHYIYQEDGLQFDQVGQNANQDPMVIPVDTLVRMRMQGKDVIHSWWVPYLMGKTDTVPGYDNYTWIKASKVGEYRGECAELCGAGHDTMFIAVKVVSQDEYRSWVQQEKAKERPTPSPSAKPPSPSEPPSQTGATPLPGGSPSPSPSPSR